MILQEKFTVYLIDNSNKILEKLSDKAVALIIKWRGKKAGIDIKKLAGHSMRSGIATSLAKEGATENEIKKIFNKYLTGRIIYKYTLFIENIYIYI